MIGHRRSAPERRLSVSVGIHRALTTVLSVQQYLNSVPAELRREPRVMDPVVLFERAANDAASMVERVRPDQRDAQTPCSEWDVDALVTHMTGGTSYLLGALEIESGDPDAHGYRDAVSSCVEALRVPGALERRCMSPAGFEWSVAEATAGTAMDQLVHTWDLAVAIGADRKLDPELVETAVAMFLPQMPEIGRSAGIVGPAVSVPDDASAQDRLLGAMGRQP
jgi:uncharacterized protein (TIGR03086 family)